MTGREIKDTTVIDKIIFQERPFKKIIEKPSNIIFNFSAYNMAKLT